MNITQIRRRFTSSRTRIGTNGESGFTLVELLVVLVILVLIASIIGPRVIGYLGSSRAKTANVQIQSLVTAVELFRIDVGRYPTVAEGLQVLVKPAGSTPGWNGPYLAKDTLPADPWARAYLYDVGGQGGAPFRIMSFGGDGKEGGTGEDADISS